MASWLFVLAAYLIGSVSFAVVVSKLFALPDPHSYGSGNPGATNVLRTGNKAAAALTLFGDGAKGWLAVFLAAQFGPAAGVAPWTLAAVALAVFIGHLFPVFHRFQGGKGVATAAGIMLGLDLWLAAATFGAWLLVAAAFRISSVAALSAAILAPVFAFYFMGNDPRAWIFLPIAALLVWRHKGNIEKLLQGRETSIGR
ncbi:MAG: glycerol-3-phosphate 1-O-acyltransferase PlsY [Betaproteobacteria bacterium]|nr:glycerol-3-phosphate 1-O-acyltransferase PlsY [Betaproteobacteria bacterium]